MKTEAELLALRLWLGLPADIDAWLDQYVQRVAEPHPDVLELFSLPFEQQVPAFMALARSVFEFDPDSARGSEVAATSLAQLCQAALHGELPVPQFCQTISQIDAKYTTPGLRAPYPRPLAALWNGCDWCDETWSLDHPSHVRTLLRAAALAVRASPEVCWGPARRTAPLHCPNAFSVPFAPDWLSPAWSVNSKPWSGFSFVAFALTSTEPSTCG